MMKKKVEPTNYPLNHFEIINRYYLTDSKCPVFKLDYILAKAEPQVDERNKMLLTVK
jgi:hypothetical protein